MCGSCARLVVAPRPRVPVPVQGSRPPVAVPVARPGQRPSPPREMPVAQPVAAPAAAAHAPAHSNGHAAATPVSPWVRHRTESGETATVNIELGASHDGGLLQRGVHTELDHD